jgi:hypothetical protein
LHVTLSGGVAAGLFVNSLLILTLLGGLTLKVPLIRGVSAFVLVTGLAEDTTVVTFAFPTILLWLTIRLYPVSVIGEWCKTRKIADRKEWEFIL